MTPEQISQELNLDAALQSAIETVIDTKKSFAERLAAALEVRKSIGDVIERTERNIREAEAWYEEGRTSLKALGLTDEEINGNLHEVREANVEATVRRYDALEDFRVLALGVMTAPSAPGEALTTRQAIEKKKALEQQQKTHVKAKAESAFGAGAERADRVLAHMESEGAYALLGVKKEDLRKAILDIAQRTKDKVMGDAAVDAAIKKMPDLLDRIRALCGLIAIGRKEVRDEANVHREMLPAVIRRPLDPTKRDEIRKDYKKLATVGTGRRIEAKTATGHAYSFYLERGEEDEIHPDLVAECANGAGSWVLDGEIVTDDDMRHLLAQMSKGDILTTTLRSSSPAFPIDVRGKQVKLEGEDDDGFVVIEVEGVTDGALKEQLREQIAAAPMKYLDHNYAVAWGAPRFVPAV